MNASVGPRQVWDRPEQWYRDPVSCLQSTLATVLLQAGEDPLVALGLHWEFFYKPDEVTAEEFCFPCRVDGDIARSLAPYHEITSRWWRAESSGSALDELAGWLDAGTLPIAAVDNFHLPFRPAYRDVHAAHLVVVYGVDRKRGEVWVSDAMPPAFSGPIALDEFLASWSSQNPLHAGDVFFSGSAIDRRCLLIHVRSLRPPLERGAARAALCNSLSRFERADDPVGWNGRAGLQRFLERLLERARAADQEALTETYSFGWAMQAQSYLHGELLLTKGNEWHVAPLTEAGRAVQSVSYAWTGLRVTAAHGRNAPANAVADLRRHAGRVRRAYDIALERLAEAVESL